MRLLIVGAGSSHFAEAGRIAHGRGAKVTQADSPDQAMNALRAGKGADLVLIDVRFDIGAFLASLAGERIAVPVVACGIGNDTRAAVAAIRAGAREYLPLPPDAQLIAAVLEAVAAESDTVIATDPIMRSTLRLAEQIAPSEATVLLTGESGTGKEVIARYVHRKSRRAAQAFVAVNCAAIPEQLLESELFGYEKGAFTGAVARRTGKFEEAQGGTLLLDEISEMHPRLQAKLLRAIQEKTIDRLGGGQPIKVDVRLIATSNRDLQAEVKTGNFREDLFFRLNVVNLALPTLRERPQDIPTLADYFARKYAHVNGLPERPLSKDALARLMDYNWPGNVRELENTLHRAVLLAVGSEIGADAVVLTGQALRAAALPAEPPPAPVAPATAGTYGPAGSPAIPVGRTVAEVERDLILSTLQHCLGNRTQAASILGISIRTLRNKLKDYADQGLPVPPAGDGGRALVG